MVPLQKQDFRAEMVTVSSEAEKDRFLLFSLVKMLVAVVVFGHCSLEASHTDKNTDHVDTA